MTRKPRMFTAAAITAMAMTGFGAIGVGMVQNQPANGTVASSQAPKVIVQKQVKTVGVAAGAGGESKSAAQTVAEAAPAVAAAVAQAVAGDDD